MAVGSALKVPLDMLPAPAAAIVLALLPTVSVALARRADAHPVPAGRAPRMFHEVNPTAIPWKILFGVAVYSFAIGAVKGVPVQSDPVPFVALTRLCTTASRSFLLQPCCGGCSCAAAH